MRATFGPFVLDTGTFRLERGSEPVQTQPKVLELLSILASRPGDLVTRQELQAALWSDVVVTDQSLRQVVRKLREALGDDEASPKYVETVPGRGLRFVAEVRQSAEVAPVPAERDTFVGRERELRTLDAQLERVRLVSVVGMGGVGKTRLATRFAATTRSWPGGVWFCELAEARSVDGIVTAVARTLNLPLQEQSPVVQLGRAMAARGRCLVILDNFEQVAPHAEATLGRWLDLAPEARFLVTSREILGLAGEEALCVPVLPVSEAADLFAERARGFVTPDDDAAIRDLVVLLDRLPLAIELAAARIRVLALAEIHARMADRFGLLAAGGRRVDRHATLRAVLDWSWALLTERERTALGQLAMFEGTFTARSAEAVLQTSDALDVLQALVDRSLVHRRGDRLGLLLAVQEYAASQLGPSAYAEAELRHGTHFAGLASAPFERLRAELDNLLVACRRAIVRQDGGIATRTVVAVWGVLCRTGPSRLGAELAEQVLGLADLEPDDRAATSLVAAEAWRLGNQRERALRHAEVARAIHHERGGGAGEAEAVAMIGSVRLSQGNPTEAVHWLSDAAERVRRTPVPGLLGAVLAELGAACEMLGRLPEARSHLESALLHTRGDPIREARALRTVAYVDLKEGRVDQARRGFDQVLGLDEQTGNRFDEVLTRISVARLLHHKLGRPEEAGREVECALALARTIGFRAGEGRVLQHLGRVHWDCGRVVEARSCLEDALAIHREGSHEASQALCLDTLARVVADQGDPDGARVLVAEGLEIARRAGQPPVTAALLHAAGLLATDNSAARAWFGEALDIARSMGDVGGVAEISGSLALLDLRDGPNEAALSTLDRAQQTLRDTGDPWELAALLAARAERVAGWGDEVEVLRLLAEGEAIAPRGSRVAATLARLRPSR